MYHLFACLKPCPYLYHTYIHVLIVLYSFKSVQDYHFRARMNKHEVENMRRAVQLLSEFIRRKTSRRTGPAERSLSKCERYILL